MKVLILFSLLAVASPAWAQDEVPVIPTDSGQSVKKLVLARPFQLEVAHKYTWTQEQPKISQGYLLVLEVEKDKARSRQVNMPVLYVGDKPAELTNVGHKSGRLVVIVPGPIDLAKTPIYFGSVELPERVDRARGQQELEAAKALGIRPFSKKDVAAALTAGGETLSVKDSIELYYSASDLILLHAPDETERAEGYRRPKG